ncbi:MAG: hypothetical protein V4510_06005 [bacterium]
MAKPRPAQGVVQGDAVVVKDEAQANRLHNRGYLGAPQPGNTLRLTLTEASWAVAEGRLVVQQDGKGLGLPTLLDFAANRDLTAAAQYAVYRDLRERGLVVRHVAAGLAAWPRGKGIDGEPDFVVRPHSEDDGIPATDLWVSNGMVHAIVDADGAVTYFRATTASPEGTTVEPRFPKTAGQRIGGQVLVTDPTACQAMTAAFVGAAGLGGVVLSRAEAAWLEGRGILDVAGGADDGAAPTVAATLASLRARGIVVRSGFRFGTHLRGYRGDPDAGHAEWIVTCCNADDELPWRLLARAIRVAHGVRKTFLVALAAADVQYVALAWFKP